MAAEDISCVLQACLSHDASQRQPAEQQLALFLQNNPSQALTQLLELVAHDNTDDSIKQISAVYLRRSLKQHSNFFGTLPGEFQQNFKQGLLTLLASNLNIRMKKKICDIIEILATQLLPQNQWDDLLGSIETLLNQDAIDISISGLYVLGLVTNACPKCFNSEGLTSILQLLSQRLQHSNEDVQIEAMKALSRVVFVTEDVSCIKPAVPSMFNLIQTSQDETKLQTVLECLTEITKDHSDLFLECVNDIQSLFGQLVSQDNFEADTKGLALEFLVTLAECEAQVIRRNKSYITTTIDVALHLMISIEHDQDNWNSEFADSEQNFDLASSALTRLAEAVGPPKFTAPVLSKIDTLLNVNNDWNYIHAGLCAMAQVMESFKQKRISTRTILDKVKVFVGAELHPRVQHAAISCIAIMCSDFGSKFVNRNAELILSSFFNGIHNTQNPKLQAHATKCLVNFCDKSSKKCFMKHLDEIVQILFQLADSTQLTFVQENLCNAMAEVANNAGKKFRQYYSVFSQYLLNIMNTTSNNDLQMEALRCLSYIGRAVGVNVFLNDANTAMQLSQNFITQDADILELINCWGRIAEVLENQFQPYLEAVAGEAAKYAVQDCQLQNYDSDNEDQIENSKVVEFNDKIIALDRNKLEEKEAGLLLLGKLAEFCPQAFATILEEAISNTVPLLSYPLHRTIRSAALDAVNGYAKCAVANFHQHQETQTFFLNTLQTLCQRLSEEDEMSVLSLVAHTIQKIISSNQEFTRNVLGEDMVGSVVRSLITCVREMNERINHREMQMVAPELDPEDVEDFKKENEDEAMVSQDITDAIDALLKIYQQALLPLFHEIMNDFSWMMSDDAHAIQRFTMLRIFCYIFENCDPSSTENLMTQTLQRLIECTQENDCDVRQAAVYAVGLVAQQTSGKNILSTQHLNLVLQNCFSHFQNQLEESGYDSVLDNDASTIGKILKYHAGSLNDVSTYYQNWVTQCFPMREDKQEAEWCYNRFCELLQAQDEIFLGPNMQNLPHIIDAMADAYGTSLMTDESEKFFSSMLGNMKTNNNTALTQIIMNVSSDSQTKIMQLVA